MPEVIEISFEELAAKHTKLECEHTALVKKIMELKEAKDKKEIKKVIAIQQVICKMVEPKEKIIIQQTMDFLGK